MVPTGSLKASLQEGSIQVSSRSGSLGPVSEVHGVFSNRDLTFISGEQSRATTIVYFGSFLDSSGQQLKRGFLMPGIC